MATKKNLLLFFLLEVLLYNGFDLSSIFQEKTIKDISFSDFRNSIGPVLTFIAVCLSYRSEIKKERNAKQSNS